MSQIASLHRRPNRRRAGGRPWNRSKAPLVDDLGALISQIFLPLYSNMLILSLSVLSRPLDDSESNMVVCHLLPTLAQAWVRARRPDQQSLSSLHHRPPTIILPQWVDKPTIETEHKLNTNNLSLKRRQSLSHSIAPTEEQLTISFSFSLPHLLPPPDLGRTSKPLSFLSETQLYKLSFNLFQ